MKYRSYEDNGGEDEVGEDLVQAISLCKRIKTGRGAARATASASSPSQRSPNGGGVSGDSSTSFGLLLAAKHQFLPTLPDIDFDGGRRGASHGGGCGGEEEEEEEEEEAEEDILQPSYDYHHHHHHHHHHNDGRGGGIRPSDKAPTKRSFCYRSDDYDALSRARAQIESLLLVLLDVWDGLPPTHRNTLINSYGEHFEGAMAKQDELAGGNTDTTAMVSSTASRSGNKDDGNMKETPRDGTGGSGPNSTTALLHAKLAATQHNLEGQLHHVRKLLLPTLSDATILAYSNNADRVPSRRYVIKHARSSMREADLSKLEATKFRAFAQLREANKDLRNLMGQQRQLEEECECKWAEGQEAYSDKWKKNRKRKADRAVCTLRPRAGGWGERQLPAYEKKHHDGYYLYWYVDTEIRWYARDDAAENGEVRIPAGEEGWRGDVVSKHWKTGLFVVSGHTYTKSPNGNCAAHKGSDGERRGFHRGRSRLLLATMKATSLSSSVWTSSIAASDQACALVEGVTTVNEMIREDTDIKAWKTLIKPVLEQAVRRTRVPGNALFHCTIDIPDLIRDRLGYDVIAVEVIHIKPEKKDQSASREGEQEDGGNGNGAEDGGEEDSGSEDGGHEQSDEENEQQDG